MREPLFTPLEYNSKDLRAEIMASEMLEQGADPDRVLVLSNGGRKRTVSRDVYAVEEYTSDYDHHTYTLLLAAREGLYDMLPQRLFHQPASNQAIHSEQDILKAIRQREEEEKNARRFFLPFECALNFSRTQLALYEYRLDKRAQYHDLVEIFVHHWPIFRLLDARQADIFLHLLPILHDVRDDHRVAEDILAMILQLPVTIRLQQQRPQLQSNPVYSTLGNCGLGIDLTTGNLLFEDGQDELIVTVGPVENKIQKQYLRGGRHYELLQSLLDYLLPVHLDIFTEFIMPEAEKYTRLADEETELNAVLGEDTYL